MSDEKSPIVGVTPVGLLRYCDLAERASYVYEGQPTEPKFSATLIFDKEAQATPEYKAFEAGVAKLLAQKFGKAKVPPTFFTPIQSVDTQVNKDGVPKPGFDVDGGTFIKFSSKFDIEIYSGLNERITDAEEIKKGFYPGCYARVVYQMYPTAKGISAFLAKIQKYKNGERLGGGGAGAAAGVGFDAVDIGDDDPMA